MNVPESLKQKFSDSDSKQIKARIAEVLEHTEKADRELADWLIQFCWEKFRLASDLQVRFQRAAFLVRSIVPLYLNEKPNSYSTVASILKQPKIAQALMYGKSDDRIAIMALVAGDKGFTLTLTPDEEEEFKKLRIPTSASAYQKHHIEATFVDAVADLLYSPANRIAENFSTFVFQTPEVKTRWHQLSITYGKNRTIRNCFVAVRY